MAADTPLAWGQPTPTQNQLPPLSSAGRLTGNHLFGGALFVLIGLGFCYLAVTVDPLYLAFAVVFLIPGVYTLSCRDRQLGAAEYAMATMPWATVSLLGKAVLIILMLLSYCVG